MILQMWAGFLVHYGCVVSRWWHSVDLCSVWLLCMLLHCDSMCVIKPVDRQLFLPVCTAYRGTLACCKTACKLQVAQKTTDCCPLLVKKVPEASRVSVGSNASKMWLKLGMTLINRLLSYDQQRAASLIGRNSITWRSSLSYDEPVGGRLCIIAMQYCCNTPYTHTHPFNGPFSGTTQVDWYQKGKTSLDFTEARDSEWQWHQLGRMQVSISLQTDNHTSTPSLSFLQAGCPSCRPTNSVKALKATVAHHTLTLIQLG